MIPNNAPLAPVLDIPSWAKFKPSRFPETPLIM